MKKQLLAIALIWLTISSCDFGDGRKCYHGSVIMSSCCTGTSFIELDTKTPLGKPASLNGQQYRNVIQVPGYLDEGEIYLNLRRFDPDNDQSLYPTPICYCLVAEGMNVPLWVETAYSESACPMGGN